MLTRMEHFLHYMPDRVKFAKQMWNEVEHIINIEKGDYTAN